MSVEEILSRNAYLLTIEGQRAPFHTLYESLSLFALTASLKYLYVSRRWRDVYLPGVFVTLLASSACLYALLGRSPEVTLPSPLTCRIRR